MTEQPQQDFYTVDRVALVARATQVIDEAVRGGHFNTATLATNVMRVLDGDTQAVVLRCPGNCYGSYDEPPYPEEDCPVHGRPYVEVWRKAAEEQAQARQDNREYRDRVQEAESQVQNVTNALRNLVDLKDGPRDEHYEQAKPLAWDMARMLVGSETKPAEPEPKVEAWDMTAMIEALSSPQPLLVMPDRRDDVTLVVGPTGKVSQVIFHDLMHTSLEDVQVLSDAIAEDGPQTSVLVLSPQMRVREVVVTRPPEEDDEDEEFLVPGKETTLHD